MSQISRSDRTELARIVRMRAKVARNSIEARKAELLANFEDQLAAEYDFDDARWRVITDAAKRAVDEADAQVAAICDEVGIPADFRPRLNIVWYDRGKNAVAQRRAELRNTATARLDAMGKAAKVAIDHTELDACTELAAGALESDQARDWLERLPTVESLMPRISLPEIEMAAKVEDRQLSYRERRTLPSWNPAP
jgi:hypothetical protein